MYIRMSTTMFERPRSNRTYVFSLFSSRLPDGYHTDYETKHIKYTFSISNSHRTRVKKTPQRLKTDYTDSINTDIGETKKKF